MAPRICAPDPSDYFTSGMPRNQTTRTTASHPRTSSRASSTFTFYPTPSPSDQPMPNGRPSPARPPHMIGVGVNNVPPPGFFPDGLLFPLDQSGPVFSSSRRHREIPRAPSVDFSLNVGRRSRQQRSSERGGEKTEQRKRREYPSETRGEADWALHSWDTGPPILGFPWGVLPTCPYRMTENGEFIMAPAIPIHLKKFGFEFVKCDGTRK